MDAADLFGGPPSSSPGATETAAAPAPFPTPDDGAPPPSAASLFGAPPVDESAYKPGTSDPTPVSHSHSEPTQVQAVPDDLFGGGGGGGSFFGVSRTDVHPPRQSLPIVAPSPALMAAVPPRSESLSAGLFGGDGGIRAGSFEYGASGTAPGYSGNGEGIRDVPPPPPPATGFQSYRSPPAPKSNNIFEKESSGNSTSVFSGDRQVGAAAGVLDGAPSDSFRIQQPGSTNGPEFDRADFGRSEGKPSGGGNAFGFQASARTPAVSHPPPTGKRPTDHETVLGSKPSEMAFTERIPNGNAYASPSASEAGASVVDMFGAPPADMFGAPPPSKGRDVGMHASPTTFGAPPPIESASDRFDAPPASLLGGPPPSPPRHGTSTLPPAPPQHSGPLSPPESSFPGSRMASAFPNVPPPPRPPPPKDRQRSQRDAVAGPVPMERPPSAPSSLGWSDDDNFAGASRPRESSGADKSRTWSSSPPPPPRPPPPRPSGTEFGSPPVSVFGEAPASAFGEAPQETSGQPPKNDSGHVPDTNRDPWGGGGGTFEPDRGATPSASAVFGSSPSESRAGDGAEERPDAGKLPFAGAEVSAASGSAPPRTFAAPPMTLGTQYWSSNVLGAKSVVPPRHQDFVSAADEAFGAEGGGDQSASWWQTETAEKEREDTTADAKHDSAFDDTGHESKQTQFPADRGGSEEPQQKTADASTGQLAQDPGALPTSLFGAPPAVPLSASTEDWQQQLTNATLPPPPPPPPMPLTVASSPPEDAVPGPNRHAMGPASDDGETTKQEEIPAPGAGETHSSSVGEMNSALSMNPSEGEKYGQSDENERHDDGVASPEWEGKPSPPLELGVFGAPTTDAFKAKTEDSIGASGQSVDGAAKSEGAGSVWGVCLSDDKPIPEQSTAEEGRTDSSQLPLSLARPPPSPPRLFGSRSESWRVSRGGSTSSTNSMNIEGMFGHKDNAASPSSSGHDSEEVAPLGPERMTSFKSIPSVGAADVFKVTALGSQELVSTLQHKSSYLAPPAAPGEGLGAMFQRPSYREDAQMGVDGAVALDPVAEGAGETEAEPSPCTSVRALGQGSKMNVPECEMNLSHNEAPCDERQVSDGTPSSPQFPIPTAQNSTAARSNSPPPSKSDVSSALGSAKALDVPESLEEKKSASVHTGTFDVSHPQAPEAGTSEVSKLPRASEGTRDDTKVSDIVTLHRADHVMEATVLAASGGGAVAQQDLEVKSILTAAVEGKSAEKPRVPLAPTVREIAALSVASGSPPTSAIENARRENEASAVKDPDDGEEGEEDEDDGWGEEDWGSLEIEDTKTPPDTGFERGPGTAGAPKDETASVGDRKKADEVEMNKDDERMSTGGGVGDGGGACVPSDHGVDMPVGGSGRAVDAGSEEGGGSDERSCDSDRDTVLSVAETTASDFFAPTASLNNENPESPKRMSRNSSRVSLSSVCPLSDDDRGSTSGARRDRKGGRGVHDGLARLTYSPFLLARGPPMFPLSAANYPRARRGSGGGLPRQTPVVATTAESSPNSDHGARSEWRSLSPSRLVQCKDRWGSTPATHRGGGSVGGSPRLRSAASAEKMAGGASVGLSFSQRMPRAGGLNLPPRSAAPKYVETARLPDRGRSPPLVEAAATSTRQSQVLGMAYRGRPKGVSGTFLSPPAAVVAVDTVNAENPPLSLGSCSDAPENAPDNVSSAPVRATPGEGRFPLPQPPPVTSKTHREMGANGERKCPSVSPSSEGEISSCPHDVPSDDVSAVPSLTSPPANESSRKMSGPLVQQSDAAPTAAQSQGRSRERDSTLPEVPKEAPDEPEDLSWATGGESNAHDRDSDKKANTEIAAANGRAKAPTPPALSHYVFGVTAQPSPLVNTSSPLTRPRNVPSLFGTEDREDGGSGENVQARDGDANTVGEAEGLFATHAPAGSADSLFTVQDTDSQAGAAADGSGGGNRTECVDPFSQGPPPERPPTPSTSLPNPWGSSPQNQPLSAPKVWPTKGGTGFDRPLAPTNLSESIRTLPESSLGGAGTIPAAFGDPPAATSELATIKNEGDPHTLGGSKLRPKVGENPDTTFPSRVKQASIMPSGVPSMRPTAKYSAAAPSFRRSHGGVMPMENWRPGAAAASSTAAVDNSMRDPGVKPPGVIAMFGFGGKLVCMHPRQKMRLASAPGIDRPGDEHTGNPPRLRKGPVKVWCVKDLVKTQAIMRDADAFPGPAAAAPAKKLKEYVEARAADGEGGSENHGERLLWTVVALSLQFKGRLTSEAGASDPASPEAALVKFLKEGHARLKDASRSTCNPPSACASPRALNGSRSSNNPSLFFPGSVAPSHGRTSSNENLSRPGGTGFMGTVPRIGDNLGNFTGAPRPGVGNSQVGALAAQAPGKVGPFGGAPAGFGGGVGGSGDRGVSTGVVEESGSTRGSQEEVEALLVDGKKEEAVDASVRAGLWGLALLIASSCPVPVTSESGDAPPQSPYQRVVRLYANAFLHSGTPLYTMALAFSGQAGAAIKHGGKSLTGGAGGLDAGGRGAAAGGGVGVGGRGVGGFEENWMATAAAIVSNKVPGWAEQLTGLGDRLVESGEVPAAHALFLVADVAIDLPTTKSARLVLPGVDHRDPNHRALRTRQSSDAVHILEVLDLARTDTKGRNSAVQGHKLRLAMRLADLGFLDKAAQYAGSTREEVSLMGGRSQGGSGQRSPYSPQFVAALHEFEDRVCAALGVPAPGSKSGTGDSGGGKRGRNSGSTAAGAGGWLLNRVTNLVKHSATPGPMPTQSKPSTHAPTQPQAKSSSAGVGVTAQHHPAPPAVASYPQPAGPAAWGPQDLQQQQQQQQPHDNATAPPPPRPGQPPLPTPFHPPGEQKAGGWMGGGGSITRNAVTPPLPSGVTAGRSPYLPAVQGRSQEMSAWGSAMGRASSSPAVPGSTDKNPEPGVGEMSGQHGPANTLEKKSAGGVAEETAAAGGKEPPRPLSSTNRSSSAGRAAVAQRLLNKGSGRGVPHVSSEPMMARSAGEAPKSQGAEGRGRGKAGDQQPAKEQAPKSEPKSGQKGGKRRASASADSSSKPWAVTKMMTKWLYPDATHADVGRQMEAYFDEDKKQWVFPGEPEPDQASAPPPAPPTGAQLASPPSSLSGTPAPAPATPGLDANDPLAALMAPPKASIGAPRRHTSVGMGAQGPPLSGGTPSFSGGPPSGGMSWARPAGGTLASPFGGVGGGAAGGKLTAFAPKVSSADMATSASRSSSASSVPDGAASSGS